MGDFFSTLWHYWGQFGEFLGDVVGRGVLMLLYVTLVAPFALITRFADDYLDIRGSKKAAWVEREEYETSLEKGYSQT